MIIAACQVAPNVEDVRDTSAIEAAVREAAHGGARVIVLPELAVTGYWFRRGGAQPKVADVTEPALAVLSRLSREHAAVIVCGVPERADGRWWNSAVVLDRGTILGHYRKVHLWGQEKEWFAAAEAAPLVIDTSAGRVAVMIC